MSFSKTLALATGTLTIDIDQPMALFDRYISFAARNNPKRGFLFISKVLGKHYPCKPSAMLASYQALADLLLAQEKNWQQCVFIAMAETATALGTGVYENWLKKTRKQGMYCQSTRYFLAQQPYLDFEEAHSHASDFFLYLPQQPDLQRCFNHADTLVLIDDEISTGNTFINLINAYKKINPALKQVAVVSLLNLTDATARHKVAEATQMPVQWLSLLTGTYQFTANADFQFNPPNVDSTRVCKKALLPHNYGRLGINAALNNLAGQLDTLSKTWQSLDSVLVLGTGEFIYHAYLLGLQLEQQGFEVYVQSTTRSPILVGEAIHDCVTFIDNYGDGITNFLYNSAIRAYKHILVCHETPKTPALNHLLSLLNATSVQVSYGTLCISRP
jgi:hypothetical protein